MNDRGVVGMDGRRALQQAQRAQWLMVGRHPIEIGLVWVAHGRSASLISRLAPHDATGRRTRQRTTREPPAIAPPAQNGQSRAVAEESAG